MPATVVARKVIIAVRPRLLEDTLVRALAGPDIEVFVQSDSATGSQYDIAVVMDDLPDGVTAQVVVRLPEDAAVEQGSITTPRGTQPASMVDLAGLLQALDDFLRPV